MVSLTAVDWYLPLISFFLVFIVSFAILQKTKVLGDDSSVSIFLAFIFGALFVVNTSLVEFVRVTTSWISVVMVFLFFVMVILAFSGFKIEEFFKGKAGWGLLVLVLLLFVVSSAYVFSWAINWGRVWTWAGTDWFGFLVLIILAFIVSKVMTK